MTIPIRQASWATIEYLAYPVAMFALEPFFVQKLGVHHNGLWIVLIALGGFGGLAGVSAWVWWPPGKSHPFVETAIWRVRAEC